MDFGIAIEKMKQGFKVKRKNMSGYLCIARHADEQFICQKFGFGLGTAILNSDDVLATDWEIFGGCDHD